MSKTPLPIVNSPGGIANVNFYTSEYESADIFGGSNPRYLSGEYGNLYGEGQSAGTLSHVANPMPDTGVPIYSGNENSENVVGHVPYWDAERPKPAVPAKRNEGYVWLGDNTKEDFELSSNKDGGLTLKLNHPVLDVIVLVFAYLALYLLQRSVSEYIILHSENKQPDWRNLLLWAVVCAVVAALIVVIGKQIRYS